ncbi:MAG: glutaredoxin family protein [Chloroflexi bacterium]|nr:glutaredoxin family protein [Chloroflexota bacterium]
MTAPLPVLVLYRRAGCGLCDEARETLSLLLAARAASGEPAPHLVERDISLDPELERAFLDRIPVVEIGGRRVELTSSPAKLRRLLEVALGEVPAAR